MQNDNWNIIDTCIVAKKNVEHGTTIFYVPLFPLFHNNFGDKTRWFMVFYVFVCDLIFPTSQLVLPGQCGIAKLGIDCSHVLGQNLNFNERHKKLLKMINRHIVYTFFYMKQNMHHSKILFLLNRTIIHTSELEMYMYMHADIHLFTCVFT